MNIDARKKELSPEDKAICANLRRIWDAKKKVLGLSQLQAAQHLGITQGAISHQLQGRNALHTDAIIQWAELLQCSEQDIDPNRQYFSGSGNAQVQREISEILERVGPKNQTAVMAMLRTYVAELTRQDDAKN